MLLRTHLYIYIYICGFFVSWALLIDIILYHPDKYDDETNNVLRFICIHVFVYNRDDLVNLDLADYVLSLYRLQEHWSGQLKVKSKFPRSR